MFRLTVPVVTVLFFGVAISLAVVLHYPYSDDDVVHYLMARYAFAHPGLFLDIWGRPGFTLLHCLPAQLGIEAGRAFSLALSCLTGWLVAAYFRKQGSPFPALAMGLTVFQAFFLMLSFGTLTETVHAAFLALGLLLLQRERHAPAALALSWTAITRLESMPLLFVFAAYFLVREWRSPREKRNGWLRTFVHVALLGAFPLIWNALIFVQSGFTEPLGIVRRNHFLQSPSDYGSGHWFDYPLWSFDIHGPIITVLALVGAVSLVRRRNWLIPLYVAAFYTLQSVLWATGSFATAGYRRFCVSIAPAIAICATYGVYGLVSRKSRRIAWVRSRAFAPAVLIISLVLAVPRIAIEHVIVSYRPDAAVEKAVLDVQTGGGVSLRKKILSKSPFAFVLLHLDPWDALVIRYDRNRYAQQLEDAESGTFILYSSFKERDFETDELLLFYDEQDVAMARERNKKGLNYGHLLKNTRPIFREVADYSVLDASDLDRQGWPYYVKLFVKTAAADSP